MKVENFGSLLSGQMFILPEGDSGCGELWVKTSCCAATSYGDGGYGSCSFAIDDKIIAVSAVKVAALVLANKENVCR